MKPFNKLCNHDWEITQVSNVIQFDSMGYPLRLVIQECKKCGKSEQAWYDSTQKKDDVVCEWYEPEKSNRVIYD